MTSLYTMVKTSGPKHPSPAMQPQPSSLNWPTLVSLLVQQGREQCVQDSEMSMEALCPRPGPDTDAESLLLPHTGLSAPFLCRSPCSGQSSVESMTLDVLLPVGRLASILPRHLGLKGLMWHSVGIRAKARSPWE